MTSGGRRSGARAKALNLRRRAAVDRLGRRADRVLVGDGELIDEHSQRAAAAQLRVHRDPLAFGERSRWQEAGAVALRVGVEPSRCTPVCEPATLTACRSPAGMPRKLICACGEASRLPASGETVTRPSWSAELPELAGVQAGPDCRACAPAGANPIPTATAGPRIRARMESIDPKQHRRVDRRTFLKGGLAAGGILAGGLAIRAVADTGDPTPPQPAPAPTRQVARPSQSAPARRPNILVIVVDQLRFPQWFSTAPAGLALPGNLQRLREGAVSFTRHYTASNDCTPSRSALLTGLYTHQTGCMITGGSTLTRVSRRGARCCASTATTRAGMASGISPTTTTSGRRRRRTGARAVWLRRRHLPLPGRGARPGLARRPAYRRPVRGVVHTRGARRAVVHDGLLRQPARHRLVVR